MVKHLILDLGGVILNINYQLTRNAFEALGIENFNDLYSQANQTQLFDRLETGKISGSAFVHELMQLLPDRVTAQDVVKAWNAMLLDFPSERLALLQKLKGRVDLFLLSNTNEIHLEAFEAILQDQHRVKNLEPFFHQTYYSHICGLRKPHAEVFQMILDQHQLLPQNTLFVDDSIQHLEGAKRLGIQTHHLIPGQELESALARYLNF